MSFFVKFETYSYGFLYATRSIMAPMIKKQCINNPNYTFSGKESSPLGIGYVAEAEQTGKVMEGRDKTMWMVGMKNGVKVWNRVPTELAKEKPIVDDTNADAVKVEEPVSHNDHKDGKTKAPRKKKVPVEKEKETEKENETLDQVNESNEIETEAKEAVKKRAPAKKKVDDEKKEKKAPSKFNIYMQFRLKTMGEDHPEMKHKEKWTACASEWKTLSKEEQDAIVSKATV